MNTTSRICSVFLFVTLATIVLADELSPRQMSSLTAGFNDPLSEDFTITNLRHSHERSGACSCPSIFGPNVYTGPAFSADLIAALEYAQCLWSCVLSSATPGIIMRVNNVQTSAYVLASAGPWFTTSDGTEYKPCALFGSLCSVAIDMNIDPDAVSYYFGTDGLLSSSQYDFVTVVMHELGHGFGFSGFIDDATGGYSLTAPQYVTFDTRVLYNQQSLWSVNPPTNIVTSATAVVSGALSFRGTSFTPKLYAPNPRQPGSSIYHFDERSYPQGNPDSLMTPIIYNGEANHVPGQLLCDLLVSIGYVIQDFSVCGHAPVSMVAGTSSPTRSPSRTPTPVSHSRTPSVSFSATRTPSKVVASPSRTPSPVSPSRTPSVSLSATRTPSKLVASASRTPSAASKSRTPTRTPIPSKAGSASRTPSAGSRSRTPTRTPTRTPSHA